MNNIFCHIIGLNTIDKNLLNQTINNNFEIIDLDKINNDIISKNEMDNLYKKYISYKKNKNDKYKDLANKMNKYWEDNFLNIVENSTTTKKKYILIGNNYNFNNINKKINLNCQFKFNIKPSKQNIRNIIKMNLEKFKNEIILGLYPLNNIDFNYQYNLRNKVFDNYKKYNYICLDFDEIISIFKLLNENKVNKNVYVTLKDEYNINSNIYPYIDSNKILYGYDDILYSVLETLDFNKDDFEKVVDEGNIRLIQKNDNKNYFDKNRFVYKVENINFFPNKKDDNLVYISYYPVKILEKHSINVKNYLKDLKLI